MSTWSFKASEKAAIEDVKTTLTQDAEMLSAFVESVYLGEIGSANRLMNVFESVLGGQVTVGPELVKTGSEMLPAVKANGKILNGNFAILEEMERRIGKTGVGLQIPFNGKVYRILTTNKDKDGNYLFGATVPDADPLAVAAKEGKSWQGLVFRNGKARATVSKPITTPAGQPIGILAITLDVEKAISQLANKLNSVKVGKTGYVYALGASDGGTKFIFHPTMSGKDINEVPENARVVLNEVMARTAGTVEYLWPDAQGNEHLKMVAFREVPGLGWKVVTGSLVNEFVEQVAKQALTSAILMAFGLMMIVVALVLIIRTRLSPIKNVLELFDKIGQGDLTVRMEVKDQASKNEIDLLENHALETMTRIRNVVSTAKTAALDVTIASKKSQYAATEADRIASHLGEQAHAMAANVEQVSVAIDHVADSAVAVSEMTEHVSHHAQSGEDEANAFHANLLQVAGNITATAAIISRPCKIHPSAPAQRKF